MEIRTVLPSVYYLNGTILDEMAVAGASITLPLTNSNQIIPTYLQVINFFLTRAKIINAPTRRADNATVARYLSVARQLMARYPDIVAGNINAWLIAAFSFIRLIIDIVFCVNVQDSTWLDKKIPAHL